MLENNSPPPHSAQPTNLHQDDLGNLNTQIKQLTDTVSNQQKLLELKERINKLVIVGLDVNLALEDTPDSVNRFLEAKLKLNSINFARARRLGDDAKFPRPILVTFLSHSDKKLLLSKRSLLAGSKVFINNDLTLHQRQAEKNLRDVKSKLLNPLVTIDAYNRHTDLWWFMCVLRAN